MQAATRGQSLFKSAGVRQSYRYASSSSTSSAQIERDLQLGVSKDHYKTLGINPADTVTIWRRKFAELHRDLSKGVSNVNRAVGQQLSQADRDRNFAKLAEIMNAWEVMKDDDLRKAYLERREQRRLEEEERLRPKPKFPRKGLHTDKDLFSVLGLQQTADKAAIEEAFKKLYNSLEPQVEAARSSGDNEERLRLSARLADIQQARDVLRDDDKRRLHLQLRDKRQPETTRRETTTHSTVESQQAPVAKEEKEAFVVGLRPSKQEKRAATRSAKNVAKPARLTRHRFLLAQVKERQQSSANAQKARKDAAVRARTFNGRIKSARRDFERLQAQYPGDMMPRDAFEEVMTNVRRILDLQAEKKTDKAILARQR